MNRLKNPLWIALIVFVVNLIVRLIYADAYFLHGDEPFTVYFAQWPIADIYKIVSTSNNPPTFEIILHGWMKLTGVNPFGLRLLPVLLISLSSAAIALIAYRIGSFRLMISSSILFLLTNFQMDFSHTLRAYSLLICSSCWSVYFFLLTAETPDKRNRIGWIIASFLTIAGHYFGWFIILVQWVALFAFRRENKKSIRHFLVNNGILFLLYAPLLIVMIKRYIATLDEGTFLSPVANLLPFYQIGMYAFNSNEWLLFIIGLILIIGILIYLLKTNFSSWIKILFIFLAIISFLPFTAYFTITQRFFEWPLLQSQAWAFFSIFGFSFLLVLLLFKSKISFEKKTIVLWATLPLLIVWFCSFKVPMFLDRYLAHILTSFVILIPMIIWSWSKAVAYVVIPVVSLLFLFTFQIAPTRVSDSPLADKKLKEMKNENTVVIVSPGYQDFMFSYFYDKKIYTDAAVHRTDTLGERIVNEQNFAAYKEGIRRALRRENIYVINEIEMFPLQLDSLDDIIHYEFNTSVCYPDNKIKETLEAEFGLAKEVEFFHEGIYLYHYKRYISLP